VIEEAIMHYYSVSAQAILPTPLGNESNPQRLPDPTVASYLLVKSLAAKLFNTPNPVDVTIEQRSKIVTVARFLIEDVFRPVVPGKVYRIVPPG